MADIKDQVHELDETLKAVAEYCEKNGKNKYGNPAFRQLVRDGERRFTKYGYVFNGTCFVYRRGK